MSNVRIIAKRAARTARKTGKKVTLDDVWETINEIGKAHAETEAALKETQRIVGGLGNKFGDEAECALVPGLQEKFSL
ncbi:MAG: hypothetical protein LBT00_06565 [Spirochaetaceae bacterium]|jgi:hypothetical protein|nr:hypothetical protein [Spirochaetaceae bacterium]